MGRKRRKLVDSCWMGRDTYACNAQLQEEPEWSRGKRAGFEEMR